MVELLDEDGKAAGAILYNPAVAPILLPDYSTDEVAERRWPEAVTKEAAAV